MVLFSRPRRRTRPTAHYGCMDHRRYLVAPDRTLWMAHPEHGLRDQNDGFIFGGHAWTSRVFLWKSFLERSATLSNGSITATFPTAVSNDTPAVRSRSTSVPAAAMSSALSS